MRSRIGSRLVTNQRHDEEVRPYIDQLMTAQHCSQANAYDDQPNNLNNESGPSEVRKVRGPTLLREVWNLPPGKIVEVQFNSRNQAIGKEGRKLASFLGIIARNPELTPLNINDWRVFDKEEKKKLVDLARKKFSIPVRGEAFVKKSIGKKWKDYKCDLKTMYVTKYKTKDALIKNRPSHIPRDQWTGLISYWFSDKAKKRSRANRISRAQQKMPHTCGSKSIATLMNEKAIDGIEPTRAQAYILTHTKRKDGRPLDEDSSNAIDMINEKLSNDETSNEQPHGSVAWEGDVYSQVLGNDKSGYVRGLGLGPTPSLLWGSKSSLQKVVADGLSNEAAHKLDQEIKELRELNKKQEEEMALMRKNQKLLISELSWLKQVMCKYVPAESSGPQNIGVTIRQVSDANSGNGQATQPPRKRLVRASSFYSQGT